MARAIASSDAVARGRAGAGSGVCDVGKSLGLGMPALPRAETNAELAPA